MNSDGLNWKQVRAVLKHAIESDPNTPPEMIEARANETLGGKIPAGTLQRFLDGKTDYLKDNVLGAIAETLLLEREDFQKPVQIPFAEKARRGLAQKKEHPFKKEYGWHSRPPEELEYLSLTPEDTKRLSNILRARIEKSGYKTVDVVHALKLSKKSGLYNLVARAAPAFDHSVQDYFLDLCALLNETSGKSGDAQAYMKDLLREAAIFSPERLEQFAGRLTEINAVYRKTLLALGNTPEEPPRF